ncbi:MAG: hypothetical protein NZ958_01840 [Bacteroidia bacterium]|nr:hypothetical protein [Bacteroidia bacterium]MDW8089084.1 hypothetical protein [Bacteroidia bacterium]
MTKPLRLFLIGLIAMVGCMRERRDGDETVGHGTVTTLELGLVKGNDTIWGRYKDPDGYGGRPPSVDTLRPDPNTEYSYFIRLRNESGNPPEDLTQAIIEGQKDYHRFFFLLEPETLAQVTPQDQDSRGKPIGAKGKWVQGPSSILSGRARILLRHYLSAADKDYGLERGSTDIDATIPVKAP